MHFGSGSPSAPGMKLPWSESPHRMSDETRETERLADIREDLQRLTSEMAAMPPHGDILDLIGRYDPRALEGPPLRLLPPAGVCLAALGRALGSLTAFARKRPMFPTPNAGGPHDGERGKPGPGLRRVLP